MSSEMRTENYSLIKPMKIKYMFADKNFWTCQTRPHILTITIIDRDRKLIVSHTIYLYDFFLSLHLHGMKAMGANLHHRRHFSKLNCSSLSLF